MRRRWLRNGRPASIGTWGLACLGAGMAFPACSGSSKSNGNAPVATSGAAGQGGSAGTGAGGSGGTSGGVASGGRAGAGAASGGTAGGSTGGTAGTNTGGDGVTAGSGGAPAAGNGGEGPVTGGTTGEAGEGPGEAGRGGSDTCTNLCTESRPACCTEALQCVEQLPRCRIDVLAGNVGVTYEYEALQTKIAALSGEIIHTIEDVEIDWAAAQPPPAGRFEFHVGKEASARIASLAVQDAITEPFRVTCDAQELFVGVFYMLEGAAAIRTPVLHIEKESDGAIILRLGAVQGAWLFSAPADPTLAKRIDRPELRATFCKRGVLTELMEP